MIRRPPQSTRTDTLFPYTTLFRSARHSWHMVRFSFAGHDLVALREGALFWPARGALLVADLHLEKASWFARGGQMLPPYDSIATLADLTALVERIAPAELWCLGRSEERRGGEECVSTCRVGWAPCH